jgi:hypothetical protein
MTGPADVPMWTDAQYAQMCTLAEQMRLRAKAAEAEAREQRLRADRAEHERDDISALPPMTGPTDAHRCRHIVWERGQVVAVCICGHRSPPRKTTEGARRDAYRHWQGLAELPE